MDKQVRIKEQSIKRLENDIKAYEKELSEIQQEKEKEEAGKNDCYLLKMIAQRYEETKQALDSTHTILKKTKAELEKIKEV
ncbi:hypothetical protein NEAUS05_0953 [Nematocida ausubeli]|uniref:Tubulin-specific chaperone A n=1 Tax=Nematocida ausubeli (strain ATCC PRA-371 / ERTm2) TaxID=1913371 RepID=H8ZDB3_NEMA1|nr:hypothetical protein NERG_01584 [Nematocida ausubeli]KAI5134550.1 hypothetical protein NEAUS07_0859 [Nematocida ausubeli]KAI5147664.1 hypothetical protein NEAUS05_0953 [Nematocida ausubeli]